MIEAVISNLLRTDAEVSTHIGGRVYVNAPPEPRHGSSEPNGSHQLPYVVFRRTDTEVKGKHLGGRSALATAEIEVRVFGLGDLQADRAANAIAAAMETLHRVTVDDEAVTNQTGGEPVRVTSVHLEDRRSGRAPARTGNDRGEDVVVMDFAATWDDTETLQRAS